MQITVYIKEFLNQYNCFSLGHQVQRLIWYPPYVWSPLLWIQPPTEHALRDTQVWMVYCVLFFPQLKNVS